MDERRTMVAYLDSSGLPRAWGVYERTGDGFAGWTLCRVEALTAGVAT